MAERRAECRECGQMVDRSTLDTGTGAKCPHCGAAVAVAEGPEAPEGEPPPGEGGASRRWRSVLWVS